MATTYCVRADIDYVLAEHGVNASIDDNIDGAVSPTKEAGFIDNAIELSADRMNATIEVKHKLSDLLGNTWCKWANATMAAASLMRRRGNPIPPSLAEQVDEIKDVLDGLPNGSRKIPGVSDSFETAPAVSNYLAKRAAHHTSPVFVDTDTSTRSDPPPEVKRNSGSVHTWPR